MIAMKPIGFQKRGVAGPNFDPKAPNTNLKKLQ
jgi:hypothetical protein